MARVLHRISTLYHYFHPVNVFPTPVLHHVRARDPNAGGTRVGGVSQGTHTLLSRTTAVDRWRDGEHNGGGHPAHSGFHVLLLGDLEWTAAGHYRHGAALPHSRPVGVCRTRLNDLVHSLQRMDGHIST